MFIVLLLPTLLVRCDEAGSQEPTATVLPHLVLVIAEDEYDTDQTLPPFAHANLAESFRMTILQADPENPFHVPGLEVLESADLLMLSVRRRPLPPDALGAIRQYLARGKPLVAIRTSSHAFHLRTGPPAEGLDEWRDFDQEILGCQYRGHHGNTIPTFVRVAATATDHPILEGVRRDEFPVFGSLYICGPLKPSATLLMLGRAEQIEVAEPVAWVHQTQQGGRVFYTSLGHAQDFTLPSFVRLLRNGIFWSAGLPIPAADPQALTSVPRR